MDAGLRQQPAAGRLGQRLAVALQEPELLDALEPQLEPVAGRAAPLLLGRDRLAGPELAAQQAARQRRPDHDADVVLLASGSSASSAVGSSRSYSICRRSAPISIALMPEA